MAYPTPVSSTSNFLLPRLPSFPKSETSWRSTFSLPARSGKNEADGIFEGGEETGSVEVVQSASFPIPASPSFPRIETPWLSSVSLPAQCEKDATDGISEASDGTRSVEVVQSVADTVEERC